MHIVYKLTFVRRKELGIKPFYYIGSKSNASSRDGKIFDNRGYVYLGSSQFKGYKEILEENHDSITSETLFESESYDECLSKEREFHVHYDVVSSPKYFNLSLALENTFHSPDHALMTHVETGKTCRIPKNHPDILTGEWVGTTAGKRWFNNGKINKMFEKDQDKSHEWKPGRLPQNIVHSTKGRKIDPFIVKRSVEARMKNGGYDNVWNKGRKDIKDLYPVSEEARAKMSLERKNRFQRRGFGNTLGLKWITDGQYNRQVEKHTELPTGWRYGQTKSKKPKIT